MKISKWILFKLPIAIKYGFLIPTVACLVVLFMFYVPDLLQYQFDSAWLAFKDIWKIYLSIIQYVVAGLTVLVLSLPLLYIVEVFVEGFKNQLQEARRRVERIHAIQKA